jgi:hypothetical protein
MTLHRFIYPIALLPLLSLLVFSAPLGQHPESACDVEVFLTRPRSLQSVTPQKVVVEPWWRQHNAYGLFVLPNQVTPGSVILVGVKQVGVYCAMDPARTKYVDGVSADANHHVVKKYIRTRSALWAIVQGQLSQLQDRRNWVIWYHADSPRRDISLEQPSGVRSQEPVRD